MPNKTAHVLLVKDEKRIQEIRDYRLAMMKRIIEHRGEGMARWVAMQWGMLDDFYDLTHGGLA